ncbi:uncharacterized protein LOC111387339 [Olea europaea var. sylvestris]|uniref:uncharacterized protein LOC111387339 n=1 Tax=Olea europaea var. sylvestris TaxID=158386 RepID=UPI000C1D3BF4|nr:uncharacterized protein LOC111387339 [Olea europaea var. sylvestris]
MMNTLTSLIRPSFSFPNHTDRQCKIFNTTPASPLLPEIASVTQTPIGRYPFPGAGGTKFSRGLTIQSIYYSDTPATNHMDLPSSEIGDGAQHAPFRAPRAASEGGSRRNARWNPTERMTFIAAYETTIVGGHRHGRCFTKQDWERVVSLFNSSSGHNWTK